MSELLAQVTSMSAELTRRQAKIRVLEQYTDESACPLPDVISQARVTKAYKLVMGMSTAPWGSLVAGAVADRIIPTGIQSDQNSRDDIERLWRIAWQGNQMDAEIVLGHDAALTYGRAFALIWPAQDGPRKGLPEIRLDDAGTMIVQYAHGSRRDRIGALRVWVEDDNRPYATLYRKEGIYKFIGPKNASGQAGTRWEPRDVPDETWPVRNPFKVVPVVELPVNRKLKPGQYPYARGEFEHILGLLDRVNTLTFLGLVVAFWQGFPLRAVIGDKIKREVLKDDDGNALLDDNGAERTRSKPPFEPAADGVAQFENPNAKLATFAAADRGNLSIYGELDQVASISRTPRYYFPLENGMSNLSADAIRATDGGLVSKIPNLKGSLGEAEEEILRVAGMMIPNTGDSGGPITLDAAAAMTWTDHEHRSMAERADAASKLATLMPWQLIGSKILGLTTEEIAQGEAAQASGALTKLVADLGSTAPTPAPTPELEPVA